MIRVRWLTTTAALGVAVAGACSDGMAPPDGNDDPVVASLTITGPSSVDLAGTQQLTASAKNASGSSVTATVTWSSSDDGIATVSSTGVVTGIARGTTTVTATTAGASGPIQDTHDVQVTVASVTVSPALDTLTSIGDTIVFTTGALDADDNPVPGVIVTLAATSPGVATLAGDTLVAVGPGSSTVTASLDGRTATATVVVHQVATSLTMSATLDTLRSVGDTRDYSASATDARGNDITDGFTWASTNGSVASISGSSDAETATAVSNGSTTIRVAHSGFEAEATLVVNQQVASVSVTPGTVSLLETFTSQLAGAALDARGNAVAGVSVTWASSDEAVASVNASGAVTAQAAGDATITASAEGQDGTADVTVTAVSFSTHVQPVFSNSCALSGCHTGSNPPHGLNLSAGLAYGNLVNVPAAEAPLDRIEPGLPDSSYLIHKIQGTQLTVGGSGARMPFGGPYLSQATIDTLRAWVAKGAKNN